MQVFHFQSKKMYYSPHETASQEVEFALLPRETALVDIHPPITCRQKKSCVFRFKIVPPRN